METQNLVIFDYSWFLAKNLAYAECRIMKFYYRNSSTLEVLYSPDQFLGWDFFCGLLQQIGFSKQSAVDIVMLGVPGRN